MDVNLEGWFTDPFGRHEARWMSAGTPTSLVRDAGTESRDEPPDEPWTHDPRPIAPPGTSDSTLRADDAQDEIYDPQRLVDAAETSIDSAGPFTPRFTHYWKPEKRRRREDDR